jgi:copper chaperone CopZ
MTTTEYRVSGMTCAHCERAVAQEVGQITGAQHVEVSAATGRLVISSDAPVEDEQILAAVDEAGYQAIRIR